MVKRQLVCNVFHNIKSDDFYIGTASAIYCATGFPLPLNRSQMGALLGISEDTMIEKVVYNDFDCAYKSDLEGFNLDDTVKGEVEVKKMAVGIYYMGEILIPLATEDKKMAFRLTLCSRPFTSSKASRLWASWPKACTTF